MDMTWNKLFTKHYVIIKVVNEGGGVHTPQQGQITRLLCLTQIKKKKKKNEKPYH